MTKKLSLIIILPALLLAACSQGGPAPLKRFGGSYADYMDAGARIAVQAGDVYGDVAREIFKAEATEYPTVADMLEALRAGRADAALISHEYVRQITDSGRYPEFDYLWVPRDVYINEAGPIFHTENLRDRYNEWFLGIAADGTWEEIVNRWIGVPLPAPEEIPVFELTGENGTLRVCDTGNYPPLIYFDANGEPAGFDVEMVSRFAEYLGMDVEFTMMSYEAIGPYVVSGKADMSSATLSITDERQEGVIFGEPSVITQAVLIVPKGAGGLERDKTGPVEWLTTAVRRNLITDNRWKMIVSGLGVTLLIAFAAQVLGTALGCFVCFVLTRKNGIARRFGHIYCGLIHGTPMVVLLMIIYYVVFGSTDVPGVIVAIAAFGLTVGAAVAQNLKAAIDGVDPVEIEAARGIGFSAFRAFRAVTLPQALRRALSGYADGFVELVKATAIVGYIAIQDLTRAGDIIRSRTYDAYFPLLFVAAIYLTVTSLCVWLFKAAVKKVNGRDSQ